MSSTLIFASFAAVMLMRVLQSTFNKRSSNMLVGGMRSYTFYIAVKNVMSAAFSVLTLVLFGNDATISWQGILISGISGTFLAIGAYFGIESLKYNPMILCSIFSTSGMLLPIISGVFLFDESVSVYQFLAILTLFFGIYLIISSKNTNNSHTKFTFKSFLLLFGSFFCNGACMICQKLFGVYYPNENVSIFSLMTFLIPAIIMSVVVLFMPKAENTNANLFKCIPAKLYIFAAVLAFAVFVINQLVTLMTPYVNSAVLFTIVNGGASVVSAIIGWAMYKEKLTLKSGMGIIVSIASLVLIKILE